MRIVCSTDRARLYWIWSLWRSSTADGSTLHTLHCGVFAGIPRPEGIFGTYTVATDSRSRWVRYSQSHQNPLDEAEILDAAIAEYGSELRDRSLQAMLQYGVYRFKLPFATDLQVWAAIDCWAMFAAGKGTLWRPGSRSVRAELIDESSLCGAVTSS